MAFGESYRRILNRLGYYNYQHGFILRHLNQDTGWNSHLEKCRGFIMKAIEIHKPGKITVLGSGWLLELPLSEMLEKVNRVSLVDIIHPPEVFRQVSTLPGVELITEDISGGLIEEVWRKTSRLPIFGKLRSLEEINIPMYKPEYDPGMVISLNILSQLETLPVRHLKKKSKAGEEELNRFRSEIQNRHIDFLKKYNSVLITDVTEIFTDRTGNISEKQSVLTVLPAGLYKEEWTWDFDLKGSDYYGKRSVFKVAAIII
ncbi:MAG: hypothetical protein C0408_03825 [Odoribacter sp.]|nr:hypothetical protein [Odoribacter sp.]